MKIIHVSGFLGIGGLEKVIYHLALEQKKRGHSVEIYIYDYDREWVEFFRRSGLSVTTPILKNKGYDFKVLRRMNQDLFYADIIHTHDLNPLMYVGPLCLLRKLTFRKRPKLIHTTHGLNHVVHYRLGKLYEVLFSRLADKITGVSDKIGKFYVEEIKTSIKKILVIQNGIAIHNGGIDKEIRMGFKKWIAIRHNLDPDRPVVLSLSRIIPLKDQKFLMLAFKKRPDYQLIVVGPPSDQAYYNELKKLEDSNIFLIGSQELVSEYNLGSDLYVSASTQEGTPVAVLEAMSVETPCLISNIPGHTTLLKYGQSAEIFKIGNTEDFLKKLDSVFLDKEKTILYSKNAKNLIKDHYSVTKMVDQYLEVYK